MRILIFAATGLALLTGLAIAQEQPPAPPAAGQDVASPDAPPPPPPPGHGPKGERDGRGPGAHGRDGDRPPPPPSKAAHLRIEKGDLKLDVKCADDEPMKACADIAFGLIDKVGAVKP